MIVEKQILKFFLVGTLNTFVYYALYSIFIFLGFDYRLSVLFATLIGVLFSFKTFGKFVFDNQNRNILHKFILVYVVLYLFNIFFVSIFENIFNNYYISGLVATTLCAVISFVLNKKYVF